MEPSQPNDSLAKERDELIAEIHDVFREVSRDGGISWSESIEIDLYATEEQRERAARRDRDTRWQQLVDDPAWDSKRGTGGFSFVDEIGMRYYLPPAMLRTIRDLDDLHGLGFQLCIPPMSHQLRRYCVERFALLDDRQRACIARFLRYMIDLSRSRITEEYSGFEVDAETWQEALDSGWSQTWPLDPGLPLPSPPSQSFHYTIRGEIGKQKPLP